MFRTFSDWLAGVWAEKKPRVRAGQKILYTSPDGGFVARPCVIKEVRFIRPLGAQKREWVCNLALAGSDGKPTAARISMVPEALLLSLKI